VAEGVDGLTDLAACPPQVIREIAECGSFNDLDAAVMALDAVDRCFRESGLWPGSTSPGSGRRGWPWISWGEMSTFTDVAPVLWGIMLAQGWKGELADTGRVDSWLVAPE
jgi:hypothetical protein